MTEEHASEEFKAYTPPFTCFICGEPAIETVKVPKNGWGPAYKKALEFEASACALHAPAPENEAATIHKILNVKPGKTGRLPLPEVLELESWIFRLSHAIFHGVFGKAWGPDLLVLIPKFSIAPEHRDLVYELEEELRPIIRDEFPIPETFKQLDYNFFEQESGLPEDEVLWLRLPGGLEAFVLLPLEAYEVDESEIKSGKDSDPEEEDEDLF